MSFTRRWMIVNTAAMFGSYLVYTPIAHGVTGGHGHDMTTRQLIAHIVALIVILLIIYPAQRRVLKEYFHISWQRIIISIVAFLAMFYLGYYLEILPDGPDYDILFGYTVLGSAMWIGAIPAKGHWLAAAIAVLSFPFASFIGELLLLIIVIVFNLKLDVQFSMLHHTIFWLAVGVTTGLLGGWIGGMALSKMLPAKKPDFGPPDNA